MPAPAGDAPWLSKSEWASRRIRSSARAEFVGIGIFALVWNGLIGGIYLLVGNQMVEQWHRGEKGVMVALLFPLAGVFLALAALRGLLAWLKFGTTIFELATLPGVIGGPLQGSIATRIRTAEKPFDVSLACTHVKRITYRSGNSREVRTDSRVLWQEERSIAADRCGRGDRGLVIPVDFYVPYELSPTDGSDPDDRIVWKLRASGDVPGIDFAAEFEVPVFRTEDSRPETDEEREARLAAVSAPEEMTTDGWTPPVEVEPLGGGAVAFKFRPEFKLSDAIKTTLFAISFVAAVPVEMAFKIPICFPIGTGVLALLLVLATGVVWFSKSRVVVGDGNVTVTKSLFGIATKKATPCADVVRVAAARQNMQGSGGQQNQGKAWEVGLVKRDGTVIDTGALFNDRRLAAWIAAEMEKLVLAHGGGSAAPAAPVVEEASEGDTTEDDGDEDA